MAWLDFSSSEKLDPNILSPSYRVLPKCLNTGHDLMNSFMEAPNVIIMTMDVSDHSNYILEPLTTVIIES